MFGNLFFFVVTYECMAYVNIYIVKYLQIVQFCYSQYVWQYFQLTKL